MPHAPSYACMMRGTLPLRAFVALLFCVAAFTLLGCARLESPRLTPRSIEVTRVDPAGMTLRVEVDAYNPNAVGLTVQEVSGTVKLAGRVTLGQAAVESRTALPSHETTRVVSELRVPWGSLAKVAALARGSARVPYVLEGHARIGGRLSVEVPFTIEGTVTADQLLAATLRGLPGVPGLPGLGGE